MIAQVRSLERSFAAGELAPELYGRLDLSRYQTGLAVARNVFVTPHGPAYNRAGFGYLIETKDSTKQSVLLPFSFNDDQTYILEFGDQYIRFHTNGATLLEASQSITAVTAANPGVVTKVAHGYTNGQWLYLSGVTGMTLLNNRYIKVANATANTFELTSIHGGGNINTTAYGAFTAGNMARVYEITSPYLEADLFELHIAQSADVLTIAHNNYAQRELSRLAAASWTLAEIAFTEGPFQDVNDDKRRYVWTLDRNGVLPPVLTNTDGAIGDITMYSDDDIFESEDVGRLVYVKEGPEGPKSFAWAAATAEAVDSYKRAGEHSYHCVIAGTTGTSPPVHTEGARYDGTVMWRYMDSGYGVAKITSYVNAREVKATVQLRLPRGLTGGYLNVGLTGHTATTTWTLSGTGSQTRFAIPAAAIPNSYHYLVTVGGVRQIPYEEFIIDATGDWIDFHVAPALGVNNIVVREFFTARVSTLFGLGAWGAEPGYPAAVSYFGGRIGYAGSAEEPTDIWLSRANKYKNFGNTPLLADDEAINVTVADRKVNKIRDLVALKHLVALTSSRAWHLAGDQDNVLTPSTTAEPGSDVGISTVQSEVVGSHALFVGSSGNKLYKLRYGQGADGTVGYVTDEMSILAEHLLRQKTITDIAFQQKPYPILWCVRSDGQLLGFTYSPEQEVVGWHHHDTAGFFESVAVVNEGTEDVLYAVVRRTINGRTVRYIERMGSRLFVTLADCFFVDAGLSYNGALTATVSGAHHLVGQSVSVLADGGAQAPRVVSADGQVTLDTPAAKVHLGLSYTADFSTLPLVRMQAQAAGQGSLKNPGKVYLRLLESSSFQVGPDENSLIEIPPRTSETYGAPPAVISELVEVPIQGTWTQDGRVFARQSQPLPMTICSIVIEGAIGG